jgi:uncharacterized damage-inducible protein DinB
MQLHHLFQGAHGHLAPLATLEGLSAADAHRHPAGAPHSIAEIVAHMEFWQRWFLDRCDGRNNAMAAKAAEGWPPVAAGSWDAVRGRFEREFTRGMALARDDARHDVPLSPPIDFPPLAGYTVRDALTHVALHNAHHLGQVITIRQRTANGERRTENGERRTENGERRTGKDRSVRTARMRAMAAVRRENPPPFDVAQGGLRDSRRPELAGSGLRTNRPTHASRRLRKPSQQQSGRVGVAISSRRVGVRAACVGAIRSASAGAPDARCLRVGVERRRVSRPSTGSGRP